VAKSCLPVPIVGWKSEGMDLFPRLVLFMLGAPPLQPRVVGPYPVWGVWFPSHLPLEGSGRIQNFGL
jgi:hypothetical protein